MGLYLKLLPFFSNFNKLQTMASTCIIGLSIGAILMTILFGSFGIYAAHIGQGWGFGVLAGFSVAGFIGSVGGLIYGLIADDDQPKKTNWVGHVGYGLGPQCPGRSHNALKDYPGNQPQSTRTRRLAMTAPMESDNVACLAHKSESMSAICVVGTALLLLLTAFVLRRFLANGKPKPRCSVEPQLNMV